MRAEELRIGNYLEDDIGNVITLDRNALPFIVTKWIKCHHSIPLTEEWLLKFGFEKLEGWDDTFFFQLNNIQIADYNVSGYDYDGFNIKHIHQLQNLYFALTGEELTIN